MILSGFLAVLTLLCVASQASSQARILFIGDSLTAGYGVLPEDSFPSLIQKKIQGEKGLEGVTIVNAGISGSTSASGMSRLKWHLKKKPSHILLALGANDGLRGIQPDATYVNLSKVIELAQKNNIEVILAGMQMPPNYGKEYRQEFSDVFPKLAKTYHLTLIPFLLEGVAGETRYNQADGIHPNEPGHKKIFELVYPVIVKKLISTSAPQTTKKEKNK